MKKATLSLLCALLTLTSVARQKPVLYTTTADGNKSFLKSTLKVSPEAEGKIVGILTDRRMQVIDGFGAAVTGSTCYNLMQMTEANRKDFITRTFSPRKGLGFSYIRISIGCSDFSLSEYTCCDKEGIENFALTSEELDYVIPIIQEIKKVNPTIKILGSPWTCPIWMKVNNLQDRKPFPSWTDGELNPRYYNDYAKYFVLWIQAFRQHGININAVTVQNEPLNRGNSASLFMGWEQQQEFVAKALGPAFQKAGLQTKIYAFDHNYDYDRLPEQQQYPLRIYDNQKAASFLSGAAYHNYGGSREELKRVGAERPDKELIFTETSIGMWNDGRNLKKRLMEDMREVALGTVLGGCRAVMVWNLMLDTERGPNRPKGCTVCYGAVDIDRNDWKTLHYNSHYYAIGHMSCVVRPGAVRIEVAEPAEDSRLTYAAFQNIDRTMAFVALNEAYMPQTLSIPMDEGGFLNLNLPPRSVCSVKW